MRAVGAVTRGTTSLRRLRRVERWLLDAYPALVRTPDLVAVDLGYGAVPVTTTSLHGRLREVNPSATVVGLEIDPARVQAAAAWAGPGLRFERGGFELAGLRPHIVRAFNVLRQYDEADVQPAWTLMTQGLATGGVVVEGTCDESGRLGAWITLDSTGPRSLTLALDQRLPPSAVAARLPKALIHHNIDGESVHRLLTDLDGQWRRAAGVAVFSPRQRMATAVRGVAAIGWPLLDGPSRWRRGELTVPWDTVAPELGGESARSR